MSVIVLLVYTIFVLFQNPDMTDQFFDSFIDKTLENGWIMIAGGFLGMIFILLYRKREFISDLMKKNKSMTLNAFIKIFFCLMLAQPIFFIVSNLFEYFLNIFGYTNLVSIESASVVSTTISFFLYASFIGPIFEEIVFRGAVLRTFEKYGKVFAIVSSAALFGLFHGNLTQGAFAFVVGLVFGYVALEYSIKWTMLLHIINNFVFSDMFGRLLAYLDPSLSDLAFYALMIVLFAAGVIVLFLERKRILEYLSANKTNKNVYFYTFTAFWMIVFIAFHLYLAVSGIHPLPS